MPSYEKLMQSEEYLELSKMFMVSCSFLRKIKGQVELQQLLVEYTELLRLIRMN